MKRSMLILVLASAMLTVLGCEPKGTKGKDGEAEVVEKSAKLSSTDEKVALDFHIMSKCPYGVKVLNAITPVIKEMGDNVDFGVHYIGDEKDGELTAMHGEQEVKGNILQLCVRDQGDDAKWVSFLECQNEGNTWRKIPEGWEACAKKAEIDEAKLKACYEGDAGKKLLSDSYKLSKEKKAKGSPTIFLSGNRYQGQRTARGFGRAICNAFKGKEKPAYCANIPEPVKVNVTVISDKRCEGRRCNPRGFNMAVKRSLEGAEFKALDYSDAEGKELFEKTGEKFLPIAIFGPEMEKEEAAFKDWQRRGLKKMDGDMGWLLAMGREWDPKSEVCDDGTDNTGNGKVDCDDESCKEKKVCRKEQNNKIDVFVMSQCPFGVRVVDAMEEVIKNFKNDRKIMDFELNYIGNERDGKFSSLHGQPEVDENIRQLCAQKHYYKNYDFMEYVLCRNKDYKNNDWAKCATGKIKSDVIKKCFEGDEGKKLLTESFAKASAIGASGSPTWLLNNRYDMNARDPESIKNAFCGKNKVDGCDAKLTAGKPGKPAPQGGCGG